MGQRLIMFAGVLLGLIVMMLPGAIAGGLVWFAFHRLIGIAVLVPAAAVCTAIVLVEVLMATEALGPVYERLDVSDGGAVGVKRGLRLGLGRLATDWDWRLATDDFVPAARRLLIRIARHRLPVHHHHGLVDLLAARLNRAARDLADP